MAFNELALGQRIPDITWFCEECDAPLTERSYLYCPICRKFHSGLLWSHGNAFGHWFGLVCPDCGGDLPTLLNHTTRLLISLCRVFLWLPARMFRDRWLQHELVKVRRMRDAPRPPVNWLTTGIFRFGGMMWLLLNVAAAFLCVPLAIFVDHVFWMVLLVAATLTLPVCLAAGAVWGIAVKAWMEQRPASRSQS